MYHPIEQIKLLICFVSGWIRCYCLSLFKMLCCLVTLVCILDSSGVVPTDCSFELFAEWILYLCIIISSNLFSGGVCVEYYHTFGSWCSVRNMLRVIKLKETKIYFSFPPRSYFCWNVLRVYILFQLKTTKEYSENISMYQIILVV